MNDQSLDSTCKVCGCEMKATVLLYSTVYDCIDCIGSNGAGLTGPDNTEDYQDAAQAIVIDSSTGSGVYRRVGSSVNISMVPARWISAYSHLSVSADTYNDLVLIAKDVSDVISDILATGGGTSYPVEVQKAIIDLKKKGIL